MKTISIMTKSVKEFKNIIDMRLNKLELKKEDILLVNEIDSETLKLIAEQLKERGLNNIVMNVEKDQIIDKISIKELEKAIRLYRKK